MYVCRQKLMLYDIVYVCEIRRCTFTISIIYLGILLVLNSVEGEEEDLRGSQIAGAVGGIS